MAAGRAGTEPVIADGPIYLRPAERDDLPTLVRWLNDRRTSATLALIGPLSMALEEGWFERVVAAQGRDGYHFVGCLVEDDRPVGAIDLHELDLINGSAAIGIVVGDPADTGRGYGSAMLRALVGWAFDTLRLERLWLDVYDFNERARRMYERVGFVHEGTLRHAIFRAGRHHDVHRLAILAAEWRTRATNGGAGAR